MPEGYFHLFTRRPEDATAYRAGEPIFEEGDPARDFYVVRSGSVTLHRNGEALETVEKGGIFGELALVDGGARSASATAATDAEVVAVDQARFHKLVQETPYFAQAVMRVLAERLRRT
jgi:CRP/FNR family cyclic AMP-dependent transcriptional regulator